MSTNQSVIPSEEELAQRSRKFSTCFPDQFQLRKATQFPRVVIPFIAEAERIEAERAAALEAEENLYRKAREWREREAKRRDEHSLAMKRAALTGTDFPEPYVPEPWAGPEGDFEALFNSLHRVLEGEELWILKHRGAEVAAVVREAAHPLRERVHEADKALAEAQNELATYTAALEMLEPDGVEARDASSSQESRSLDARRVDPRVTWSQENALRDIETEWANRHPPRSRLRSR